MSDDLGTFYKLPHGFWIEVVGTDALALVNNLCTNDLVGMKEFESCECFITNLKGWTVSHAIARKLPDRIQLVGQHPSPSLICEHLDRYVIREDAKIADLTSQHTLLVIEEADLPAQIPEGVVHLPSALQSHEIVVAPKDQEASLVAMLGRGASLGELNLGSDSEFEELRVASFWPEKGREIGEKTIPQELDRDTQAISFTKGCYLGQETIARLDARGQLQRKLCRIQFEVGSSLAIDVSLMHAEKEVGKVTSISLSSGQALAFLKRGAFEVGTKLQSDIGEATVLAPIESNQ